MGFALTAKIRGCQEHSHNTYSYNNVHIRIENKEYTRIQKPSCVLCENKILGLSFSTKNTKITVNIGLDIQSSQQTFLCITSQSEMDNRYFKHQDYCIFRLFVHSMTIALLLTSPILNTTLILFSLRLKQPRERKRSLQNCSSTVPRPSVHLTSVLQPNKTAPHHAENVKTRKLTRELFSQSPKPNVFIVRHRTYEQINLHIDAYMQLYNNKRFQFKTKLTPL